MVQQFGEWYTKASVTSPFSNIWRMAFKCGLRPIGWIFDNNVSRSLPLINEIITNEMDWIKYSLWYDTRSQCHAIICQVDVCRCYQVMKSKNVDNAPTACEWMKKNSDTHLFYDTITITTIMNEASRSVWCWCHTWQRVKMISGVNFSTLVNADA